MAHPNTRRLIVIIIASLLAALFLLFAVINIITASIMITASVSHSDKRSIEQKTAITVIPDERKDGSDCESICCIASASLV